VRAPRVTALLVALSGILLGAAALALVPREIPGQSLAAIGDMRSPAFFPVLAAILALSAGLSLLPAALRAPPPVEMPPYPARAVALAALLVGGAVLAPVLGGLLDIFLLMLAVGFVLGDRRPLRMLLLAACGTMLVHLLFERMLKVILPPGLLL